MVCRPCRFFLMLYPFPIRAEELEYAVRGGREGQLCCFIEGALGAFQSREEVVQFLPYKGLVDFPSAVSKGAKRNCKLLFVFIFAINLSINFEHVFELSWLF